MSHSYRKQNCAGSRRQRAAGFSLIELLVAITIGAVLIFGATQVYVDSRSAYSASESVARLQETSRYALSIIEPDVRMSNYWGLLKGANLITGQYAQTEGANSVAGAAASQCGANFAVDLSTTLQGSNNT
jgi:type IV pilus assembly protein PilW